MKLYVVTDVIEKECVLVVAFSAKDAKIIGLPELKHDMFNVKVRWVKEAKMNNCLLGVIKHPFYEAPSYFWDYVGEDVYVKYI